MTGTLLYPVCPPIAEAAGAASPGWSLTSLWSDDLWVADSTSVECGRSRETTKRSDLAGWAEYGYCASHSRYFWRLRLHLLTTLHGLAMGFALTGAKADERHVVQGSLADPALTAASPSSAHSSPTTD
jgi:hypothetical protein